MNLRKRSSRQVRGGERVQSLIFDLTGPEFRAVALRDELMLEGQEPIPAAYAALRTMSRPSPVFVAWLSDGGLAVVANGVIPASQEAADLLDIFFAA